MYNKVKTKRKALTNSIWHKIHKFTCIQNNHHHYYASSLVYKNGDGKEEEELSIIIYSYQKDHHNSWHNIQMQRGIQHQVIVSSLTSLIHLDVMWIQILFMTIQFFLSCQLWVLKNVTVWIMVVANVLVLEMIWSMITKGRPRVL